MAIENLEQRLIEIEKLAIDQQISALDEIVHELEKNML
jgi:hypothetical protein